MMRFRGGGVGHKSTREATDFFKKDRDRLDKQLISDAVQEIHDVDISEEEVADPEDEEEDYGYIQEDTESDLSGDDDVDNQDSDDDFGYYGDL